MNQPSFNPEVSGRTLDYCHLGLLPRVRFEFCSKVYLNSAKTNRPSTTNLQRYWKNLKLTLNIQRIK